MIKKKILVALFLLSSLFLIVFALLPTVPAHAQPASTASGAQPYSYSGAASNTAANGKNSDDEDCMCKDNPSEYPVSVTVDSAGNAVPLATTATPTSDLPDLVPGLITSPTTKPMQVAPIYVDAYQKPG